MNRTFYQLTAGRCCLKISPIPIRVRIRRKDDTISESIGQNIFAMLLFVEFGFYYLSPAIELAPLTQLSLVTSLQCYKYENETWLLNDYFTTLLLFFNYIFAWELLIPENYHLLFFLQKSLWQSRKKSSKILIWRKQLYLIPKQSRIFFNIEKTFPSSKKIKTEIAILQNSPALECHEILFWLTSSHLLATNNASFLLFTCLSEITRFSRENLLSCLVKQLFLAPMKVRNSLANSLFINSF